MTTADDYDGGALTYLGYGAFEWPQRWNDILSWNLGSVGFMAAGRAMRVPEPLPESEGIPLWVYDRCIRNSQHEGPCTGLPRDDCFRPEGGEHACRNCGREVTWSDDEHMCHSGWDCPK